MACALMHQPTVLFLDEPTAGIDPVARRELWDLLFEFSGQGMTLFVTTHYMDEAERCSHVGYIYMSKLVVCGEPDELKTTARGESAGHEAARCDLRSCHGGLASYAPFAGRAHAPRYSANPCICSWTETLPDEVIRAELAKAGIPHADIRPIAPSLEDVFVALTNRTRTERKAATA